MSNELKISALELCNQFMNGEIDKNTIQRFAGNLITDIDEQTDDEILIDTIYEWEDEELNYPITKRNIQLWKLRLETGEDKLAIHNNWNVHIEPQKLICQKYKSEWSPVNKKWKIGINISENEFPINGLRHPKSKGNEGWYLWTGEYQESDDFFKPICIEHLLQLNPGVIKYLGLKEGYRFLIDNKGYEDVWFDEQLLNIEIENNNNQQSMKFLKTSMATDWTEQETKKVNWINRILFFIPKSNPDYNSKMHLVKKWLIEFIEEDGELIPWREIALDSSSNIVFAGPDKKNYGFWLDTNMKYKDFKGETIEKEEFERYWKLSGVKVI